ncbi:hypothetical protein HD806DRAFT_543577 [Xylariaceae sp. AK1471]|nr:hypothetical protein HD806DRAFT_543577 [Xylariaceae sp. AK1471]
MVPSILKQALGKVVMTREDLCKLSKGLEATYIFVDHFEALEEKRGYDNGKQFPHNLYKRGIQKQLLNHWLSPEPTVFVLDGNGFNFDAGEAGREWAAFLRVRNPDAIVLRVYPKDRTATADHILCQILSSLVYNLITLVPGEFERVPGLCKRNFQLPAQGGPQGIDAGLKILGGLPLLGLGGCRILCIVDSLDLAETENAVGDVRELTAVLGKVLAQNHGHLLYTVAKKSKAIM